MTTDPLFESLERLQPMLDSFSNSLSRLCEPNDNIRLHFAQRKDLENYYRHLHKDILSRYETLKQKEREILNSAPQPEVNLEMKKQKSLAIPGFAPTKILQVKVSPDVDFFCRETDGDGLRNLIIELKKNRFEAKLRMELPAALRKAPEPGNLVLKAIRGYDLSRSRTASNGKNEESKCKRACILLIECLFPVFGNDERAVVPKDVKDKAREIAEVWRRKMGLDKDVELADELDIKAFLQLLTTFRIAKDYGEDELCELFLRIADRRENRSLCLFLGLDSKMPDFLDKLSKTGKWMDCIRYAYTFGMMDKIKPADLLKAYLGKVKRAARDILKKGRDSADSLKNSTMLEKCALNRVIKFIKECNLQNVYSIDDLQNEVQRLEKGEAANGSEAPKMKAEDEKAINLLIKQKERIRWLKLKKDKKEKLLIQVNEKINLLMQQNMPSTEAPGERGLSRPSKRAKYASEKDVNRIADDKRNSPSRIDLLSQYQPSYHHAIRNTMGPSSDMTVNNEQKYYDSYPSTSRYSNINSTGVSLYGSNSMIGAVSSSNQSLQSYIPSPMGSACAVSFLNPAQVHSESRTLQSYTSALAAADKHSFGSPRHGKIGLTNSSSSLVQNTSAFGCGNLSNIGSSVHGSGDSLLYNFDDSPVPSYITQNNLKRKEPEQQKPSFASSNISEYGRAASVGCQSAISKYQFNGGSRFCPSSDHNSSMH